jgi:hypothetical protein
LIPDVDLVSISDFSSIIPNIAVAESYAGPNAGALDIAIPPPKHDTKRT